MESNKLSLNVTKTLTILIGGRKKLKDIENSDPQNMQIATDQEPFSKMKLFRYLRMIEIDRFLSLEVHISALIQKISSEIFMLRHVKDIFLQLRFSECKKASLNHISDSAVWCWSLQWYRFE